MNARKILMIIPYKARDLEGHALVGYHLERTYGHQVIYTNAYYVKDKILQHQPHALVLDHLSWAFKVDEARFGKRHGLKLVILPTEGLFQEPEAAVRRAGKLHKATDLPDLYFTWGDYARRALLDHRLMTENQVQTIGCPRFDFYREPYLPLMISRQELALRWNMRRADVPWVLWATNTAYASRKPEEVLRRHTQVAGKPEEEVRDHLDDHRTQLREHSALVLALAQRHPNCEFVVKVHPAEWINPYVELVKQSPNLSLVYDTPIRDLLYQCDVLLQRNCTTATEAWILGKPVMNLEVGTYKRKVRDEYRRGNHIVTSLEEADKVLRGYLNGTPIPDAQLAARQAFLNDFFDRLDGRASERCAAGIHATVSPPSYTGADQARTRTALAETKAHEDRKPLNRLKGLLGIPRTTSLRVWKRLLPAPEGLNNLGRFDPEVEITREMTASIYRQLDAVLQERPRTQELHATPV